MDGFVKRTDTGSGSLRIGTPSPSPSQLTFLSANSPNDVGVPGLIAKAKMLLDISKAQGITRQAYLADPSVAFCQSDKSDRGWGCGYRNIQMMLSYVVQQASAHQDAIHDTIGDDTDRQISSSIPTIPELQQQLEFAWEKGYDLSGARQLNHKVRGTRKWIGTTEAWSILCSLGIRCSILDFHMPTGPNGTHPAMLSAVYNYFRTPPWSPLTAPELMSFSSHLQQDSDQRVIQTAKPPLYIQHQGHSRTIIGIEVLTTGELDLLVFDPGRWLHRSIPTLREESVSKTVSPSLGSKVTAERGLLDAQYLLKAFRLKLHVGTFKAQYQLLGISGLYHESDDTDGYRQRNVLELLKSNTSLSIGWNDEEAQQSKL
ncbi:hypothetical protein BGZ54_003737, partial [Gamsiella multidivaricata]